MADNIFLVNQETGEPEKVERVPFAEIDIKERGDLEKWIINNPELLGEDLLIITSEFDKFDKTHRRLDLLALDPNLPSDSRAFLVIIELKLDANRSLADQQAIRYAAFCSTMKMDDIVKLLAKRLDITLEDASTKICDFLEVDELPQLGSRPRIILAAGSLDDPELTSCVLWLRTFGVDISCTELTPYRLPKSSQIILVPRIIIPLPEAKDYVISVEQKEASEILSASSSYFDIGNFSDDDLKDKLRKTLDKRSNLTPRFVAFLEILLSEDRVFHRDEDIIPKLHALGFGANEGRTGTLLSGVSQLLTKRQNSHLRQLIGFDTSGGGQLKDNYRIRDSKYCELIKIVIDEWKKDE